MTSLDSTGHVVIAGGSLAGLRAAQELRALGFEGHVSILSEERHPPYDRPPLSKQLLRGELEPSDTHLPMAEDLALDWRPGSSATALDLPGRRIMTSAGATLGFDGLVVATGARARRLEAFDGDTKVMHLRTLDDAVQLRDRLSSGGRLLIVGGGLIGVEVASTALDAGLAVALVTLDPPLSGAGSLVSSYVAQILHDRGVELHVGVSVDSWRQGEAALTDGGRIRADHVLVAVGAVPNADWLVGSGLEVDRGVVCDETCAALGGGGVVVAAGDVARWPHPVFGDPLLRVEHWDNAMEQGAVAARRLLTGEGAAPYVPLPSFWSDHFDARLFGLGRPDQADHFDVLNGSLEEGTFVAAGYRAGELVAGVGYGSRRSLTPLRRQLDQRLEEHRGAPAGDGRPASAGDPGRGPSNASNRVQTQSSW